jgi:carbamoylphosphate synthase large subunit
MAQGGPKKEHQMSKQQAVAVAKAMRLDGRNVQVAYQTLTHANRNGQQGVSLVYRVIENGKVVL